MNHPTTRTDAATAVRNEGIRRAVALIREGRRGAATAVLIQSWRRQAFIEGIRLTGSRVMAVATVLGLGVCDA